METWDDQTTTKTEKKTTTVNANATISTVISKIVLNFLLNLFLLTLKNLINIQWIPVPYSKTIDLIMVLMKTRMSHSYTDSKALYLNGLANQ